MRHISGLREARDPCLMATNQEETTVTDPKTLADKLRSGQPRDHRLVHVGGTDRGGAFCPKWL